MTLEKNIIGATPAEKAQLDRETKALLASASINGLFETIKHKLNEAGFDPANKDFVFFIDEKLNEILKEVGHDKEILLQAWDNATRQFNETNPPSASREEVVNMATEALSTLGMSLNQN
jgi:hypothetical protein